nr:hypothetical protein [uncultured Hyphomonas sp.]
MNDHNDPRWEHLIRWSVIVSILWVVSWILVACVSVPPIWQIRLNEAGDFWAGMAAPLAFYWLVLGFFQQGKELRLQIKEMRHSVDQFKAQTSLIEQQLADNQKASAMADVDMFLRDASVHLFDALRPVFRPIKDLNDGHQRIAWGMANYDRRSEYPLAVLIRDLSSRFTKIKEFGRFLELSTDWQYDWTETIERLGQLQSNYFRVKSLVDKFSLDIHRDRLAASGIQDFLELIAYHFKLDSKT